MTRTGQWERSKVGDVLKVSYGKGLSKSKRKGSGPVEVFGSSGLVGLHDEALVEGPVVIIGRKGNAGAAFLSMGPVWPIDTTYYIEIPRSMDPRFLHYQMGLLGLEQMDSSTAIPSLRRPDLEAAEIAIPPIDEQRRIVEAIETHFSHLDAGVESLERAKKNVERMRASMMTAAAVGTLTSQDPSETYGRELAEALEHSRVGPDEEESLGIATWPESWKVTKLGALLLDIEAGKSFKADTRPAGQDEWGVIKVSAMTWGEFDQSQNKALLPGTEFDSRFEIREGDLLLSRANTSEYVGATVLVGKTRPRLLLSDKSMRLILPPYVHKPWLHLVLSSPPLRRQMSTVATGTSDSMRNISQAKVTDLVLAVPPIAEQKRIAEEADRQTTLVNSMLASIGSSATGSEALRAGILSSAFSGKLLEAAV